MTTLIHPETINGHTVAIAEPVHIGEAAVVMVVSKDNKLVAVGFPDGFDLDDFKGYLKKGYIIRQVPMKEYSKSGIEWIYD